MTPLIQTPYVRRVLFAFCRLFHRQHHEQYWSEYTKHFWRCKRCGHHFAKPRLPLLLLLLALTPLAAHAAQPTLVTLRASWDPYPLASYPGGSNAVITLYKSTSLGTVWTPFKPTAIAPATRTNQTVTVVSPNKLRFYVIVTIQPYGDSAPSNVVTNDLTSTTLRFTPVNLNATNR